MYSAMPNVPAAAPSPAPSWGLTQPIALNATKAPSEHSQKRGFFVSVSRRVFFVTLFGLVLILASIGSIQTAFAAQPFVLGVTGEVQWDDLHRFTEVGNLTTLLISYPERTYSFQYALKLSAGAASLALAVAVGIISVIVYLRGTIKVRSIDTNSSSAAAAADILSQSHKRYRHGLLLLLGLNSLLAFAALLSSFITHSISAHFDFGYAMKLTAPQRDTRSGEVFIDYRYRKGIFDLETWVCETKDLPRYDISGDKALLCTTEMGSRWTTLVLAPFAMLLFLLVLHDHSGKTRLLGRWEKKEQKDDDDFY